MFSTSKMKKVLSLKLIRHRAELTSKNLIKHSKSIMMTMKTPFFSRCLLTLELAVIKFQNLTMLLDRRLRMLRKMRLF
jgi:hypothetical protein